jgi:hypothetical protein
MLERWGRPKEAKTTLQVMSVMPSSSLSFSSKKTVFRPCLVSLAKF